MERMRERYARSKDVGYADQLAVISLAILDECVIWTLLLSAESNRTLSGVIVCIDLVLLTLSG